MKRWCAALALLFCATPPAAAGGAVDFIWVSKSERELRLVRNYRVVRAYPIELGSQPRGHKLREGDGRTPEGLYYISDRNPNSKYHLSMKISYPNEWDAHRAAARGVHPGGDIMIHGRPNGMSSLVSLAPDWTEGCIAIDNRAVEELWKLVEDGTPILIEP